MAFSGNFVALAGHGPAGRHDRVQAGVEIGDFKPKDHRLILVGSWHDRTRHATVIGFQEVVVGNERGRVGRVAELPGIEAGKRGAVATGDLEVN